MSKSEIKVVSRFADFCILFGLFCQVMYRVVDLFSLIYDSHEKIGQKNIILTLLFDIEYDNEND
jgi:hypothetical protein